MPPILIAACALAFTAGCEQSASPPVSTIAATAATSPSTSTDFANIPGQFPSPATLTPNGQSEAPVGGCVNVSGTPSHAELTLVDCGSAQHTYRIVRRVNTPRECGDADRPYYYNSKATGQFTACLDLAWDRQSCLSIADPDVKRVSCTDSNASNKIKPVNVLLHTTTLDNCPHGGYPHPLRGFTICTEAQP
ncbi:Putative liporotein LppU [Mycobacteroides abscessus subsp. massiliense]|nr:Putative liporotein LppU [Mycobacteroides abscessus subsp. massiliense]SKZ39874.1 Putative liporotein LppU [Mycobacteroides abscessus subsp. massiliense]